MYQLSIQSPTSLLLLVLLLLFQLLPVQQLLALCASVAVKHPVLFPLQLQALSWLFSFLSYIEGQSLRLVVLAALEAIAAS